MIVCFAMQPSDDDDSSVGGVIGRCPLRQASCRIRSGDLCGDRELRGSVLLLLVLEEPRRLEMKEEVKFNEGVDDEGARVTNEESMLYAGVEGSNGLSFSFGSAGEECRLVVDDDAVS